MLSERGEQGSLSVLIIGYTAMTVVLVVVGIDASKFFLAQRALSSAADGAAIAAAQGVALHEIYDGAGVRCGRPIPISPEAAATRAGEALDASRPDLRHVFTSLAAPDVTVRDGAVSVAVTGVVRLPFGHVIGWLLPGHADGEFRVSEASHATSPVAGGAC